MAIMKKIYILNINFFKYFILFFSKHSPLVHIFATLDPTLDYSSPNSALHDVHEPTKLNENSLNWKIFQKTQKNKYLPVHFNWWSTSSAISKFLIAAFKWRTYKSSRLLLKRKTNNNKNANYSSLIDGSFATT